MWRFQVTACWTTAGYGGVLCLHPLFLFLSLKWCLPSKPSSFPQLSTPTLGRSIDCNPLCSPLKLAFGEEFRAFPISSPPTLIEGCCFFLPPPQIPFCTITTQHFPWHFLALARSHQVRLERVSDRPHLVLEPCLFYSPPAWEMNIGFSALPPSAVIISWCVFSSGFDKMKEQSPGLLRPASSRSPWWLNLEKGHGRHL